MSLLQSSEKSKRAPSFGDLLLLLFCSDCKSLAAFELAILRSSLLAAPLSHCLSVVGGRVKVTRKANNRCSPRRPWGRRPSRQSRLHAPRWLLDHKNHKPGVGAPNMGIDGIDPDPGNSGISSASAAAAAAAFAVGIMASRRRAVASSRGALVAASGLQGDAFRVIVVSAQRVWGGSGA